ncbi:unnamed protein product [Malus baccata var. baccata]
MAIKLQSLLFCMVLVALLALTECNGNNFDVPSNKKSNVVKNSMVKGDETVNIWASKLELCSESCSPNQIQKCWCCAFNHECWSNILLRITTKLSLLPLTYKSMEIGKAIKMQLATICIIFISLVILTEGNNGNNGVAEKSDAVYQNLRERDDIVNNIPDRRRRLTFCREECKKATGLECWCCAFHHVCYPTREECNENCRLLAPAPTPSY